MERRFASRIAVVTGSAGGLGRALALGYAREGATLVLVDVNEEGLAETLRLIEAEGGIGSIYRVDLSDEVEIAEFGALICARHPRIDILFNNAGIAYGEVTSMIDDLSLAKWLRYLTINSLSPLLLAKALRPALAAAPGVIVNQSSMAAYAPSTVYGATKAMLNSITFGMAQLFGADGIRVNAVAPGLIATEANESALPGETKARIRGMQLLDLDGTPEDIVALGLFLSSDDARFITCEVMSCDAGNRVRGWRH